MIRWSGLFDRECRSRRNLGPLCVPTAFVIWDSDDSVPAFRRIQNVVRYMIILPWVAIRALVWLILDSSAVDGVASSSDCDWLSRSFLLVFVSSLILSPWP